MAYSTSTSWSVWKSPKTISEHINNIYDDGELEPESTIRKFRTVAREGTRDVERLLDHYNLEAVLAVGYRVRSSRGTQFRQWASQQFFSSVQNKLHWAIHGHTAAELVAERADRSKPNMGLTSWKGARVTKADTSVAKNYLAQDELKSLNRIVTMYLDYAESQAEKRQSTTMQEWAGKLEAFLEFNDHEVLADAGRVSHDIAKQLAETEYQKFAEQR